MSRQPVSEQPPPQPFPLQPRHNQCWLAQVNANTITINTVDIGQLDAAASVNERVGEFVSAVNAVSGQTNVTQRTIQLTDRSF